MTVSHIDQMISAVSYNETIAAYPEVEVGFTLLSLARRSCFLRSDKEISVDDLLAL